MLCLARLLRRFELRLDPQRHSGPLDLRTSEQGTAQAGLAPSARCRGNERCTLLSMLWAPGTPCVAHTWQGNHAHSCLLCSKVGLACSAIIPSLCCKRSCTCLPGCLQV